MIAAMIVSIIQLIMIAWFGFIGIVVATFCDADADDLTAAGQEVCDLMGLMTVMALLRGVLVFTMSVTSCCGTCCAPAAPVMQQPMVVMQQQQQMMVQQRMMVQQPVMAQPVAAAPVVVNIAA